MRFLAARQDVPASEIELAYLSPLVRPITPIKPKPDLPGNDAQVTTLPGFTGERLKLPASIMPTALTWMADGSMAFTSLKGHVFIARDEDGDGLEDRLIEFEEGLPAPFGVLADGDDLLVATKADLLRLRDLDGDGRCDERIVEADGWGYTDNYHDWTTGPVRDAEGNLYLALGSDYQQEERPRSTTRWRGKVIRVATNGEVEPVADELRFPQGIAIDPKGRLFVTDQQGVANTFNEINHIQEGAHYGVKGLTDPDDERPETLPAVQVPHPWTRSVNGLFFLPENMPGPLTPFAGHGIGCEYNGKFLVRISFDEVNGQLQGAAYEFSHPTWENEQQTFLGPICGGVSPSGDLYIGSIYDSGWLGGPNVGEIVLLHANGDSLPNGIREIRATPDGFEVEFIRPVDRNAAANPESFSLSGYTRVWEGAYATPDSGRYAPQIESVNLSPNGRTVRLRIDELRERYVYEIRASFPDVNGSELFPNTGHYTMNRVPSR